MAQTFVSPGVKITEIDQSFLGQAIEQIGAAVIGLTEKGPAFVPTRVTNFNEYVNIFGNLDSDYILGYAARAYLRNSSPLNVVRVLGPTGRTANAAAVNAGWTAESVWAITGATGSVTAVTQGRTYALIELTASAVMKIADATNDEFVIRLSTSVGTLPANNLNGVANNAGFVDVTASFNSGSANYIGKVLNKDSTLFSSQGYYLREVYDYAYRFAVNGAQTYGSASFSTMAALTNGFNSASTPWIKSQEMGGSTEYNLFKVHTLGHGKVENGRFKVSISNVKVSPTTTSDFGTFTLAVRDFENEDKSVRVVDSFENLNFDPSSINYVLKRIGDQYWEYDATNDKMVQRGNYPTQSKYIRIEMNTGSYPNSVLPWGFRGFAKPDLSLVSGSIGGGIDGELGLENGVSSSIHPLPYVADLKDKNSNGGGAQLSPHDYTYWGVEFNLSGSVKSRLSLFPSLTGSDPDFSLKFVSGSVGDAAIGDGNSGLRYDTTLSVAASKKIPGTTLAHNVLSPTYAKFTLPLAFGNDGWNPTLALSPIDNDAQLTAITQLGVQALREGIDVIKDPDFIDINVLAIPGIHSDKIVEYGIEKIESRADAFYIIDVSGSTATNISTNVKNRGFDTSYAGVFYPDINIVDDVNGKIVQVPSSVAALGAFSFNDRVAFPWYAPAGMNRGGLNADTIGFAVTKPVDQLKESERDTLYDARVNPIAKFPGVPGATIWGQKTLQVKASALDRINVRRLLIKAKKLISSAAKLLVFEPNNPQTWTRFKQVVNPILQDIRMKNGLEDFRVILDDTTTTPDLIDRNVMKAVVLLIPTRAAEWISIDFVISRSGVSFND